MHYSADDLPLGDLLSSMSRAEDQLARLDEVVRRSPMGEGFVERGHFFDSAASMWIAGKLVHVEDLVLHDAHMDVRAPTHELTISHAILRARRRIADADPAWAVSGSGLLALAGVRDAPRGAVENDQDQNQDLDLDLDLGAGDGEGISVDDEEPSSAQYAAIDAVLEHSRRILDAKGLPALHARRLEGVIVGDLVVRDAEWDERGRLEEWQAVGREVQDMPPTLAAAVLWDAWETLEPLQNKHWLGALLVGAWLRSRRKVASHLFCFNVGLKALPREDRRSRSKTTRLRAALDAMAAAADTGMKEVSRLAQAQEQMQRRVRSRRSSSSLPGVIELILSRPIVSATMIAKELNITQRGALNLIAELGVRELTGRGRYRAWGII